MYSKSTDTSRSKYHGFEGVHLIGGLFLLFLLSLSTMAIAPRPVLRLVPMTELAASIDAAAKSGDWITADRRRVELAKQWTIQRPSVTRGIRGTAHAQSIDSAMKWMQAAVESRSAAQVHRAAYSIQKSIHEISEIPLPHT